MQEFKYQLGQPVEDVITECKGIIMARTQYLTQCNTYGISPTELSKDGKRPEWEWFDELRLKIAKGKIISLVEPTVEKTGGPLNKNEIAPGN